MRLRRVTLLTVVLAALTAPTWVYPYLPRYDSGAYVMGTASLAAGHLPLVLSHPLTPPATYPPVTMALLTPAYLLTGGSDVALRVTLALCWLAAMLLLVWHWWPDEHLRRRLPWVLGLTAFSSVWLYVGRIQSEIPYLMITVAAVACLDRLKRDGRFFGGPWGPAALSLVVAATFTRQIGLMLAVGAALFLGLDPARWRRGLTLALIFATVGVGPGVALYRVTQPGQFTPDKSSVLRRNGWDPGQGQMSLLSREFLGRVKSNVEVSTQLAPGAFFAIDFPPENSAAKVALVALALVLVVGYFRRLARGPTAAEFYVPPYLVLLLVTPWLVETRFFTVLAPWLALYLVDGFEVLSRPILKTDARAWRAARIGAALVIAAAAVVAVRYDFVDRWSQNENPEAAAYFAAAARVPADAVVLTRDPFAFYVLTDRHAMSYTAGEQKYQPPYRLPGYLAADGRLDFALYPVAESGEVAARLAEAGLMQTTLLNLDAWRLTALQAKP
jgi:hypothetical protein